MDLSHATGGTVRRLMEQFLPFASHLLQLQSYCDQILSSSQTCLTLQAFASSLRRLLVRYHRWFEQLRGLSQADTLLQLHANLQQSMRAVAEVVAVVSERHTSASALLSALVLHLGTQHRRGRVAEYGALAQLFVATSQPLLHWLDVWLTSKAPPLDPFGEFFFAMNAVALAGGNSGAAWHSGFVSRNGALPALITAAAAHSALVTGRAVRLLQYPHSAPPAVSLSQLVRELVLPGFELPQLLPVLQAGGGQPPAAAEMHLKTNGPSRLTPNAIASLSTAPLPPADTPLVWLPHERPQLTLPSICADVPFCERLQLALHSHISKCAAAAPRVPAATVLPSLLALHAALFAPASQPVSDSIYTPALEAEQGAAAGWQRDCVASWQLMRVADESLTGRLLEVSFAGVTSDDQLPGVSLAQLRVTPRADWPLSILVDRPEARELSNSVSAFAFSLHRALWRLRRTLCGRRSSAAVPRVLQMTRLQLLRVLDALTAYVVQRVLTVAWTEFEERILAASSMEQLIEAHQLYLSTLRDRCLLNPRAAIVMSHIQKLLSLALECTDALNHGLQRALFSGVRGVSSATQAAQYAAMYEQVQQSSQLLVTILARTVQQKTAPHRKRKRVEGERRELMRLFAVADLLFRLDLFFESKTQQ